MSAQENQVALPLRNHTILGVCEAIGEDFGFNPVLLRVPFAAIVLWSPLIAISAYLALGAVVLLSRVLFPKPKQLTEASGAVHTVEAPEVETQLPLAAYATSGFSFVTWHELATPYVRNQEIWRCPSSSVKPTDQDGKPTTHFGYNVLYLTNIRLDFSNANGHRAVSLAAVGSPAETVFLADAKASLNASWPSRGTYALPRFCTG